MKIYNKYILQNILVQNIVVIAIITAMIWVIQSLRFIDLIITSGIEIYNFLYITILIIPSILFLILPITFFIGLIQVYNKLHHNNEITILFSMGLSKFDLVKPAIKSAIIFLLFSYFNSLYLLPKANYEFKENLQFYRDNYFSMLIQEGVFVHPHKNISIYVFSKNNKDELKNIFIHDTRDKEVSVTITAKYGKFTKNNNQTILYLENGNRQEIKSNSETNILYFDQLEVNLDLSPSQTYKRSLTVGEMNINQLLLPDSINYSQSRINKMLAEGHFRIVWPLILVIIAFINADLSLSRAYDRQTKTNVMYISTIHFVVSSVILILLNYLGGQYHKLFFIQYLYVFIHVFYYYKKIK